MQAIARAVGRATCRTARPLPVALRCNHTDANNSKTTHFGFQTVPEEQKESLVKGVFTSVASSYDVMNDAMSLGVHRLWKDDFVSSVKPGMKGPLRCIDVAGGTGDIALRILDFARENYADRETSVDVVDINIEMLREGYKRFKKTMYHNSAFFPLVRLSFLTDPQHHRSPSLSPMPKHYRRSSSRTTHMIYIPLHLASAIARQYQTSSRKPTES